MTAGGEGMQLSVTECKKVNREKQHVARFSLANLVQLGFVVPM